MHCMVERDKAPTRMQNETMGEIEGEFVQQGRECEKHEQTVRGSWRVGVLVGCVCEAQVGREIHARETDEELVEEDAGEHLAVCRGSIGGVEVFVLAEQVASVEEVEHGAERVEHEHCKQEGQHRRMVGGEGVHWVRGAMMHKGLRVVCQGAHVGRADGSMRRRTQRW